MILRNKVGSVLNKIQEINVETENEYIRFNVFSFMSLNNGTGAKTVASQIAYLLESKNTKVCLLDGDIIHPYLGYNLNTIIEKETSLLQYTNYGKEINEVYNKVKGVDNLWIVSASLKDKVVEKGNVGKQEWENLIKTLKETFDFVVILLNYNPFAEWFIYSLPYIDKGFIVVDEQLESIFRTKYFIEFVNSISARANSLNNIIINKCTNNPFEPDRYKDIKCNVISELPFINDIVLAKNEGKIYIKSGKVSNDYLDGMKNIITEISKEVIK